MSDEVKPWHRREGETDAPWQAFQCYLYLGKARTLREAWGLYREKRGIDRETMNSRFRTWSSQYDWSSRCRAYDDFEDALERRLRLEAREKARDVFVDNAVKLARRAVKLAFSADVSSAQVAAVKMALDRAGITVPKDMTIDVDVTQRTDHRAELRSIVEGLEDLSTAELTAAYQAAIAHDDESDD